MKVSKRRATQVYVLAKRGPMTAGAFAVAMGYGGSSRRSQVGASVLTRLRQAGFAQSKKVGDRVIWFTTRRGRELARMMST